MVSKDYRWIVALRDCPVCGAESEQRCSRGYSWLRPVDRTDQYPAANGQPNPHGLPVFVHAARIKGAKR